MIIANPIRSKRDQIGSRCEKMAANQIDCDNELFCPE
jgi:hypothetical protein